jgi:hypothetical protein
VSWQSQRPGIGDLFDSLRDVTWNGEIFMAVGDLPFGLNGPLILTSHDGETWTLQEIGVRGNLYGIVWNGEQFVAVGKRVGTCFGGGCAHVYTISPDGVDWTLHVAPYFGELRDITWSAGLELFVAIGVDGYDSAVLTSSDGASWSIQIFSNVEFDGITWNGTRFVIVGNGGTVLTSSDGEVWSPQNSDSEEDLSDVVSDNTRLVVVGDGGTILTSTTAVDWTRWTQSTIDVDMLNDVIWADGRFIAVGNTLPASFIVTSTNGSDWISTADFESISLNAVAWNGNLFVAVGFDGTILTSLDAENWVPQASGTLSDLTDVTWGNNQFAAIGSDGTIVTSEDGMRWVSQVSGTTGTLNRIIWGNNEFVAVGAFIENPIILTSADGEVWEQHVSLDALTDGILYSVAWGNEQYMVAGDNKVFITSNLVNWTIFDSLTTSTLRDVTWGGNQFIVVGGDSGANRAAILTLSEGKGWIRQHNVSRRTFRGVTWNGSQFVVIGDRGTILRKLDICEGDFEPDGDVDGSDLAIFAADFGRTDCDDDCEGDFDTDNDVDGSDLAVFAADFGRTDCPMP